jgi:hypothetical protein
MPHQNVLMVGIDAERYESFAPMLQRKHFDVDRFPGAQGAMELVTLVPFTAIIIHYPIRDVALDSFLQVIRGQSSASREARIALVSLPDKLQEAEAFLNKRIQLVVSDDEEPDELDGKISDFLGIKSRAAMRVLVKLDVALEDSKRERFMAQSKDISASGMFVTTKRLHPVGSRALFEFTLPTDSTPFCGSGEITRHSGPRDRIQGIGVRFLTFTQNTQENLTVCLEQMKQ